MSKNFEAKKVVVSEIEEKIEKAQSIVIVEYKALTVEAITALRAKCRAANVDYCVLKNTLMKRALENFKAVLDLKVNQQAITEAQLKQIVGVIDRAAMEISQLD